MSVKIDQSLCDWVKAEVKQLWPEKHLRSACKPYSRCYDRYIQVSTPVKNNDLHYEFYEDHMQLHFEGIFVTEKYKDFRHYLVEKVPTGKGCHWKRWMNLQCGRCQLDYEVNDWADLIDAMKEIVKRFDKLINNYVQKYPALFPENIAKITTPNYSYVYKENFGVAQVKTEVCTVSNLDFDKYQIPPYQRPYKWTAKNVNQLISDLLAYRDKSTYRLGTLVLFNDEIVDGQQRMVTLGLLLTKLYSYLSDERVKENYREFMEKVSAFTEHISFTNRYSLHNVVENLSVIETRKNELGPDFMDFLLNDCEFVVISLNDMSEAFQFFDSQNSRGKDLEPHDLLKAYHLREITDLTEEDTVRLDAWQRQQTYDLKSLFLVLYRAKLWSQGKSAHFFSKDDIDVFKGLSLKDGKRYPFYMTEVIASIFTDMYRHDPTRLIDSSSFEYPFNLDDEIINGSRFFDMISHYTELFGRIQNPENYEKFPTFHEIGVILDGYEGSERAGDQFVKGMYYTALLYYVDRFGESELEKVAPKIFVWAYYLRLMNHSVYRASIDNYARAEESIIRKIHDAKTPYDVINISQRRLSRDEIGCSKCSEIVDMFKNLNKLIG